MCTLFNEKCTCSFPDLGISLTNLLVVVRLGDFFGNPVFWSVVCKLLWWSGGVLYTNTWLPTRAVAKAKYQTCAPVWQFVVMMKFEVRRHAEWWVVLNSRTVMPKYVHWGGAMLFSLVVHIWVHVTVQDMYRFYTILIQLLFRLGGGRGRPGNVQAVQLQSVGGTFWLCWCSAQCILMQPNMVCSALLIG